MDNVIDAASLFTRDKNVDDTLRVIAEMITTDADLEFTYRMQSLVVSGYRRAGTECDQYDDLLKVIVDNQVASNPEMTPLVYVMHMSKEPWMSLTITNQLYTFLIFLQMRFDSVQHFATTIDSHSRLIYHYRTVTGSVVELVMTLEPPVKT